MRVDDVELAILDLHDRPERASRPEIEHVLGRLPGRGKRRRFLQPHRQRGKDGVAEVAVIELGDGVKQVFALKSLSDLVNLIHPS